VVTRLSGCLGHLTSVQRRVLVLRTGLGDARPHSRRGVARLLHLRVHRVVRIERRGLHEARTLARDGACGPATGVSGSGSAGVSALASSGGNGGSGGTGGADDELVQAPSAGGSAGGAGGSTSSDGSTGTGEVRGESETQLPPPLGTGAGREPGGVSLAIGIALILLALLAGFATPHLRGRLRSS